MKPVLGKAQLFDELLGQYVRMKRQEKNLTIDDLISGAGLHISRSAGSKLEQGRQRMSVLQLFLISGFLDIKPDHIFMHVQKELDNNKYIKLESHFSEIVNKY